MELSSELVSQFVKATKDTDDKRNETTVYGTAVEHDGSMYVRLDGSELLTPISTTTDTKAGERVTVMIKNHTAVVTGNMSSPAARTGDVNNLATDVATIGNKVSEFDDILADTVTTDLLEAERARIKNLETANVTIKNSLTAAEADIDILQANEIAARERLTANEAVIENLKTTKLDANVAEVTYATIESLEATDAKVHNLEATYGEFARLTTDKLSANEASINALQANKADVTDLDAVEARVDILEAGSAKVNTLMFGSATGDTIQTSFSNSVVSHLGDAQIKSAQIKDISADKITTGTINTNDISVMSEDGSLVISDETMQISDGTRVRVQIGKDASNDYSINIWDTSGNLMFSKGGITDSAIKNAIIRNDMVSDTANIAAHKLDIDSLFEEINGSTNTIKSTKVYLDDESQTLDVAFKTLSTTVTDQGETISSQGTAISTIQGQISSKVWQQDIDTAAETMSTKYTTLDQKVDSITSTVSETYTTKAELAELEIGGRNLVTGTTDEWTNITVPRHAATVGGRKHCSDYGLQVGDSMTYSIELNPINKTALRARLDFYSGISGEDGKTPHFGTVVQNGAPGKSYLTVQIPEGSEYVALMIANCNADTETSSTIEQYRKVKLEKGSKSTDWTAAPEDTEASISDLADRVTAAETAIDQTSAAITLTASKTDVATAKSEAISAASADATAKSDAALASANANTETLLEEYSTTSEMNAVIELKANSITSSVSETYATKSSVNNLEIGGRNLLTKEHLSHDVLADGGVYTYSANKTGTIHIFEGLYLEPGDYMYSLYMKRTAENDTARIRFYKNGTTISYYSNGRVDGEWGIVKIPFTVTSADDVYASQIYNHSFESTYDPEVSVKKLKIERGDKATDWTPAPEDIDERIESAESSITQLSDRITANVTETTSLGTRMSTVEQTASGLTTRLTAAETNVTNAAKTATNYLNFSDNGLTVGDMTKSSLGKNVRIDSDSIDIRNGETVMASFKGDEIILGQNAEGSTINLCNGAGKISAQTSEASTSYPEYDSILIEAQEINTSSQRFVADVTNSYNSTSTPTYQNDGEIYMLSYKSSAGSYARMTGHCTTTSSGDMTQTGVSASALNTAASTSTSVYAEFWDESAGSWTQSNQVRVYPTKTTASKPIWIQGTEFTGENKVLWSGVYYMSDTQTATLSAAISAQANGVVLVWSYYTDGAADNSNFQMTYIPKHFITLHPGKGVAAVLTNGTMNVVASKYVYVSDTSIKGYAGNDDAATEKTSGVTSTAKNFVLRYVIGV